MFTCTSLIFVGLKLWFAM